jgi:hypothetical protein
MSKKSMINIFEFLGIEHHETIISKFLVSVMNQDTEYLKMFLEQLNVADKLDYHKCAVNVEHPLNSRDKKQKYGRADIWIGSKEEVNKRIVIENKIFAVDQYQQITRYRQYLDEKQANREGYLFYLTLQGKDASAVSTKVLAGNVLIEGSSSDSYRAISYCKDIIPWLEKVESKSNNMKIKFLIKDFLKLYSDLSKANEYFEEEKSAQEVPLEYRNDFKSLCEMEFWKNIEKQVLIKSPNAEINSRRKYSYEKIKKNQSNKNYGRSYGIIFNDCRVQLLKDGNKYKIKFSKGKFSENENKWIVEGSETLNPFKLKEIDSKNLAVVAANGLVHFFDTI